MLEAFVWGLVGAASLVLGALIVQVHTPRPRALGLVMGFGAGVLLASVSFELVDEAVTVAGGLGSTAIGFFAGALTFFAGDVAIGRYGRYERRKAIRPTPTDASPLSIVLGASLDGIPESAALGLTVLREGSVGVALLFAVFVSNLPESIAASSGLLESGWTRVHVTLLWSGIALVSGLAAAIGYVALDGAGNDANAFVLAFAGGAILTMLSTTMMPEAYEHAGRAVGLMTTLGFAVAYTINWLA
ncbi:MAG: ZIP family metal transporter [Acidimicrobiia bacterium]